MNTHAGALLMAALADGEFRRLSLHVRHGKLGVLAVFTSAVALTRSRS